MKVIVTFACSAMAILHCSHCALAQSYSIDWSAIGPSGTSTGATYSLSSTINQPGVSSTLSGGTYSLAGGFLSDPTANSHAPLLSVSPSTSLVSSGSMGGPFSPSSQSYTLSNSGNVSLSWSITKAAPWLSLSASAGTLPPNTAASITISINANANGLAVGSYSDTVSFVNTSTGLGNTSRSINLNVTAPAPGLVITPSDGLISSGAVGGPFTPVFVNYRFSNSANASLHWTASAAANWFTITPTGGILNPGDGVDVGVQLNGNAYALQGGTYSDTVSFVNTTTGVGNTTRPVVLTIANGLNISGPFTFYAVGYVGGPFDPSSVTNQLRNVTGAPLTWAATLRDNAANYANLSQTGGTLAPGEVTTVIASLNELANGAGAPSFRPGDIWFTNLTSGIGSQSHPFALSVAHRLSVSPDPCCNPGFYAGGSEGGPFQPDSFTYVLRNETSIPQSWAVTHDHDWLTVSNASGTLAPGASTQVTLGLSAAANSLPATVNSYGDAVRITLPAYPADSYILSARINVVQVPPMIVSQPGHHTVWPGATVTFNVVATGSQPLRYDWLRNGDYFLVGATNSLTLRNVTATDVGHYSVRIRNDDYTRFSEEGTLALLSLRRSPSRMLELTKADGDQYRIDYKNSLDDTNWTVLDYAPTGTTSFFFLATNPPPFNQRFYRAVYSP